MSLSPEHFQRLWELDDEQLLREMAGAQPGSPAFESGAQIVQVRVAVESRRVVTWTRWLAIATFVMAAATVVLAIAAV